MRKVRHFLITGGFLLVAAVANVSVAWACHAFMVPWWAKRSIPEPTARGIVQPFATSDWPEISDASRYTGFGKSYSIVKCLQPLTGGGHRGGFVMQYQYGWPVRSLQSVMVFAYLDGVESEEMMSTWIVPRANRRNEHFYFPLGLVWPGFFINTMLYAAVLWLLICGPFTLRRFMRMKRGLCPACAYPVGDSTVCIECGRELPRAAT